MKVIEESDLVLLGINPENIVHVQWKKEGNRNVIYVEEDNTMANYPGHGNRDYKNADDVKIVMDALKE